MNEGDKLKSLDCTTSRLDITSDGDIQRFKQAYGDGPLDLLLNVAGTLRLFFLLLLDPEPARHFGLSLIKSNWKAWRKSGLNPQVLWIPTTMP